MISIHYMYIFCILHLASRVLGFLGFGVLGVSSVPCPKQPFIRVSGFLGFGVLCGGSYILLATVLVVALKRR